MANQGSSPHASDRARRRRLAAEQRAQSARILVCECRDDGTAPLRTEVRALGYDALPCSTLADALREAARTPFDVVIVALPAVSAEQASLLHLLRRSLAAAPLVIVSDDGSLEARARCQPARPYYFAVPPVSEPELRAILSGAVEVARRG
jgi:DNA-binding response OmpR family regulator